MVSTQWVLVVDQAAERRSPPAIPRMARPTPAPTAATVAIATTAPVAPAKVKRTTQRRRGKVMLNLVLAFAGMIGIVLGASVGLPAWLGLKSMIVISGSMEPVVRVGDVVLIEITPADRIAIGDVITFRTLAGTGMTTHRVVARKEIQGRPYFQTRGDANDSPDADLVPAEAIYGKVAFVEPKVGYLLNFATTLWGKLTLIILPVLLVVGSELFELRQLLGKRPAPKAEAAAPTAGAVCEASAP